MKDAFKRAFRAFLQATREGFEENLREETAFEDELKQGLEEAALQKQKTQTTACY